MMEDNSKNISQVSPWLLFWTFLKVGAFTIGGGYAMMVIIEKEVTRHGWMTKEDFADVITLAISAPGLIAVNVAIFTGYKIMGTKGSIIASIGSIIAPFSIILAVAMLFTGIQDNPVMINIFKGIRPVVVALIIVPMVQMAKISNKTWQAYLLSLISFALVAFLKVSPIYIIASVIFGASIASVYSHHHIRNKEKEDKK